MFLVVFYQIVWVTNMCLQDADAHVTGGKRGNQAAAASGLMDTADQADTATHLGMASFPLQHGVPDNLSVNSGAFDKPETVQVHLTYLQGRHNKHLLRRLSPSGMYVSSCMVEMTVNAMLGFAFVRSRMPWLVHMPDS